MMERGEVYPVVVVMGVAGSGKSVVGRALAGRTGGVFVEGDDLHEPSSIARMASGRALDDAARNIWLQRIVATIRVLPQDRIIVVACSALKRGFRERFLAHVERAVFVHLALGRELALQRVKDRSGHFMPVQLVDNQFDVLEPLQPDERGETLDATLAVEAIAEQACIRLRLPC